MPIRSLHAFEPLEARQLLTSFAFNNAWIDNAIDRDGDGFNRSVEVWFNLSATGTGTGHFYVDVFEDDGPTNSDWLVRTSTNALAAGANTDLGVAIPADLLGLPGDDSDGVAEFRLNLVDADSNSIVQTWTLASSAALGNVQFESAAADAVLSDSPPVSSNLRVGSSLTYVTAGDQVALSVDVTDDVQPQFVLFWIDKDGNGVPNPETDSIGAGGSFFGTLSGGSVTNGTWTANVTVDESWGSGTIHIGAIAADDDGNYSTPITTTVRMNVAPTVASVIPSASVITFGQSLTLTAASDDQDGTVQLTTFYIDVDSSGGWTNGVDIDLGADSSATGGWTRTVTVLSAWGVGSHNILAAARDNDGAWGAPTAASVRFNAAPVVSASTVTVNGVSGTVLTNGDSVTLGATATDSGGSVARVTFILDNDGNGIWSNGDVDLGFDTDGSNGWSISFVVPSNWSPNSAARIIADAVDGDGVWASTRSTTNVRINDRPVVSSLISPPLAAAGQSLHLTASATDSNLHAVSFFVDRNLNGVFDAGTDVDLGADFSSSGGWTLDITVQASWAGTIQFAAAAVDTDNIWSSPRGSGSVVISAGPLVASLNNTASGTIGAGESFTLTGTISAGVSARAMTFFIDVDGNRAWTPGVDIDLGSDNDGSNGWTKTATVQSSWGNLDNVRFVANAVNNSNQWGTTNAVTSTIIIWAGPRVTSVVVTGNPADGIVTHDRVFTLTATLAAATGIRAVSFFFDANDNGRWDSGVDTDLGADFDGTDGWSVTPRASASWGTPAAAHFVATAVSTTGAWGRNGLASSAVRLNDRTTLSNFAPSSPTVAHNASVTFSVDAVDAWGVGAVTMFLDLDGNGFWTQGVDVDLGTATRTAGTSTSGTWSITAINGNWATGTLRIVADARDSDGMWSGRRATTTLTVV